MIAQISMITSRIWPPVVIGFAHLTPCSHVALGIESEGFAAACGLTPMDERGAVASTA